MKSTLMINDLCANKELERKEMSAVRGGQGDQGNVTGQSNTGFIFAPVSVGNGSQFNGPTSFQVTSNPTQNFSNDSSSRNIKSLGFPRIMMEA